MGDGFPDGYADVSALNVEYSLLSKGRVVAVEGYVPSLKRRISVELDDDGNTSDDGFMSSAQPLLDAQIWEAAYGEGDFEVRLERAMRFDLAHKLKMLGSSA